MTNADALAGVLAIHDKYRYWSWGRLALAMGLPERTLHYAMTRGSNPRLDTMDRIRLWYEANCAKWPVGGVPREPLEQVSV